MAKRVLAALVTLVLSGCAQQEPVAPVVESCDNDELTGFDSLLVLAPHPDDEVPGILPASREGLLDCTAYLRSFGRRSEVFVVEHFTND